MYVTYVKILAHIHDHVWWFYSNCQTLESRIKKQLPFQFQYLSLTQTYYFFSYMLLLPEIKETKCLWSYISCHKSSHAELFFKTVSLKLQDVFWIHCCVISRILDKPHCKRSFLVTLFVCSCEFMPNYFLIYS